jgi:anaerobic dimethyl sulfoxide reductase subunit B (iron-sulfur subunit)
MNERELGFRFEREKCIQCHGCETACKTWRSTPRGVAWRRVLNIWSGSYPDVTCTSLSIGCLHCAQPACAAACPTGAVSKRDNDGAVLVDRALCIGCRACLDACPYDVPRFGADGLMQKCDMCLASQKTPDALPGAPPCVRTCPTGALELTYLTADEKIRAEKETTALYQKTNFHKNG